MSPLVLCSLIVIVTLAVSGAAKAKEPASTATAIVNLDLDRWVPMKLAAAALPWVEIVLALWLLFAPGLLGVIGAAAVVALFIVYWLVILRAVVAGNTASCNCFGGASTAPISGYTLARNTALLAASLGALGAAITTGHSVVGMLTRVILRDGLWLGGAALLALALWSMYRSELTAPASAPGGSSAASGAAPAQGVSEDFVRAQDEAEEQADYVRLPIPYGALSNPALNTTTNLRELATLQARVLFWVTPGCTPCMHVLDHISDWQKRLPMLKLNPVVSTADWVERLGVGDDIEVLVDEDYRTEALFGHGTPLAVALGSDGLMAGGPVIGSGDIIRFMEELLAEFDA